MDSSKNWCRILNAYENVPPVILHGLLFKMRCTCTDTGDLTASLSWAHIQVRFLFQRPQNWCDNAMHFLNCHGAKLRCHFHHIGSLGVARHNIFFCLINEVWHPYKYMGPTTNRCWIERTAFGQFVFWLSLRCKINQLNIWICCIFLALAAILATTTSSSFFVLMQSFISHQYEKMSQNITWSAKLNQRLRACIDSKIG